MATDAESQAARSGIRWWVPLAILVAGGALIGGLQIPDLFTTDAHVVLATTAAVLLVAGSLVLWAIFGTGLRRATRVKAIVGCLAAVGILIACVRIDGMTGNLVPRLAWRWSPKPDEELVEELNTAEVDLTATTDHDFPQFLGPNRDGTLARPALARDWQAKPPRELWRRPIGAGWSAFAVVGEFAVTQEQRGEEELVTCYEARTGKLRWSHADPFRFTSIMAGDGPRATPTIDNGRIYALGAFGTLNALDGATGQLLWSHDLLAEHHASNTQWGRSCSPLVTGKLVVVSAGGANGYSLVAYDKVSGELVWHAGNEPSSYASPVLATLLDTEQVLMVNQGSLSAHAPDDGHILWEYRWPGGEPKVADPIPLAPDRVFIAAGYGLGCQLLQLNCEGDAWREPTPLWKKKFLKPKFTNVVAHGDYVYGLDDGRTLVCLALADGKRRWHGGRYGHGQVLAVNDLLLVQSEQGEIALVEASPKRFHELTRFKALDGQSWNTPALAGRYLFVRTATEAACYELPLANDEAVTLH
jgi:outer membrane protein assembly factor BamB